MDGEGSFGFYTGARITVNNTYPWSVVRLRDALGGTLSRQYRTGSRTLYRWLASGQHALDVAAELYPFLHEKQLQAAMLMRIGEMRPGPKRDRRIQKLKDLKRIEYE